LGEVLNGRLQIDTNIEMVKMSSPSLKQKPIKLAIIITLALIISSPLILPHQVAAQNSEYYNKSFAWDYNGKHWTWNLSIPKDLYDAYKAVPVSTRTRNGPGGYGFLTTTEDHYIQTLALKLNETTTQLKYNSFDQVSFVLAFVQSLPYTSDSVTTGRDEYPRFPIETLVDDGGDCEDTSILFATLTLTMGYGTVYINPPNHYAVGILGNDLHGTYWTYPEGSNKTYYYCETTGDNFKIGQLPDTFQGQSAYIYSIDESKQFVPDVVVLPTSEPSPTDSPVTTLPTPTIQPTPTDSASPTVTGPTVQPVLPLSFNLIADNPLLFIIITFAIVVSIALAVWSVRKPKHLTTEASKTPEPSSPQVQNVASEGNKFCIYCGSNNKIHAVYCEKCGKQIGQQSA
jgi:hypothetical protein